MMSSIQRSLSALIAFALVASPILGCGGETGQEGPAGEPGADGTSTLVDTEEIDPGDECDTGGLAIHTGVDEDGDGRLSDDEITDVEYLCRPEAETARCEEPFSLQGVTGTDQRYFEGVESDPISVESNADDDISLSVVGGEADIATDSDGSFTITPQEVGGPYEFIVVAATACGTAAVDFSIDEFEEAVATAYLVHLFEDGGEVDFATVDDSTALATLDFADAAGPVSVQPDTYEFELLDGDDAVATSPAFDFAIGEAYTVVAYSDDGDVEFALLEDDLRQDVDDDTAVLRAFHGADGLGAIDLASEDSDGATSIFEDLAFADDSDYLDVDTDFDFVLLDDGDEQSRFSSEDDDELIEAGSIVNAFVFIDDDQPNLLLQPVSESPSTIEVLAPVASFHDIVSTDTYATFSTGGDAEWTLSTEEVSTGDVSTQAGDINDGEITWLEAEIEFDSPGELSFDWYASSEPGFDELLFCDDPTSCSGDENTATLSDESGWETYTHSVDQAGTHSFRWAYHKDSFGAQNRDTGWVDNIEIIAN